MHALRIEPFASRQVEQGLDDIAADPCRARVARNAEMISPARDLDVETVLDLPQVFVELAAEIRQTLVIRGLEQDIAGGVSGGHTPRITPDKGPAKPIAQAA